MSLADYVVCNIAAAGPGPSFPGFGVGLIASYHTKGGARRVMGPYTGIAGVAADFTDPTEHTYLAAATYFSQNPAPSLLYIGRRANAYTQLVTITPVATAQGTVYTFQIGCTGGVGGTQVQYTVGASATVASICTALAALINTSGTGAGPLYNFTADGTSGTHILCTQATAGRLVEFQCQVPVSICRIGETTSDPGLTADLNAIWAENKGWYGLGLDSSGHAENEAAGAWTESTGLTIFVSTSSDSDVADPTVTTDTFSHFQSTTLTRTAGLFTQYSNMSYGGIGWMAGRLTATPGSDTWMWKSIAGVQTDSDLLCPEASVLAVQAKNGTVYTTIDSLNVTQGGTSGSGEWMDQTRFIDWLKSTIQISELALLAGVSGKIPFTNQGIMMIETVLRGVLQQGVAAGGLVDGSIVITTPDVSTVSSTNKQARTLPGLPWSAKLAGAIHRMNISGVLTV